VTREEFLSDSELVKSWRSERENNSLLKMVDSIAEAESPNNQRPATGLTDTDALIAYGYALGYSARGRIYSDLATLPPVKRDPTKRRSTYGIKEKKEET
jgi:hypothetical protein